MHQHTPLTHNIQMHVFRVNMFLTWGFVRFYEKIFLTLGFIWGTFHMWFYEESIFVLNLHVKNLTWELTWDSNVRSHIRSNMRFMLVHFGKGGHCKYRNYGKQWKCMHGPFAKILPNHCILSHWLENADFVATDGGHLCIIFIDTSCFAL